MDGFQKHPKESQWANENAIEEEDVMQTYKEKFRSFQKCINNFFLGNIQDREIVVVKDREIVEGFTPKVIYQGSSEAISILSIYIKACTTRFSKREPEEGLEKFHGRKKSIIKKISAMQMISDYTEAV